MISQDRIGPLGLPFPMSIPEMFRTAPCAIPSGPTSKQNTRSKALEEVMSAENGAQVFANDREGGGDWPLTN